MLDRVFAIVVINNDRKIFEVAVENTRDETPYRERHPGSWWNMDGPEAVRKSWRRRKEHTFESFEKSLFKVFPTAIELASQHAEFQDDVNHFTDLGEVYHFHLSKYGPQMNPASRMDANGEWVSLDGVPLRLINNITGKPYPEPPPGQHRYTVGINTSRGISIHDVHKMYFGEEPRAAALEAIAFNLGGGGLKGDAASIFKIEREDITVVMVTDKDTEKTVFFQGADAIQNQADRDMTDLWSKFVDGDEEGLASGLEAMLAMGGGFGGLGRL